LEPREGTRLIRTARSCSSLILTGQRLGEIASLRWEWIGEDAVTIPAEITKNGRATAIPIGNIARQITAGVPRLRSLLFPARGHTDKPFNGFAASKVTLDKCGVKDFTHHDLRRTFATNMAKLGVRLEVTEKLLNHVSGSLGGIVGVYQRHDFKDEMREAVTKWEMSRTLLKFAERTLLFKSYAASAT